MQLTVLKQWMVNIALECLVAVVVVCLSNVMLRPQFLKCWILASGFHASKYMQLLWRLDAPDGLTDWLVKTTSLMLSHYQARIHIFQMPGVIAGGAKSEAQKADGMGFLVGVRLQPHSHQLGGLWSVVSSSSGSRAKPRRPNEFVHFMSLRSHILVHKV